MQDESLSSVDQFLRDNGFSISDPAVGLSSLSGDELLDEELLLSDADERLPPLPTSSSRSDESPRFVLLEDQDLLLGDEETGKQTQERLSGDRTTAEEKKEDNDDDSLSIGDTDEKEPIREQGCIEADGGDWIGLNDLLRKNGLPAVRFRRIGTSEALPDRDSLFNVIHDFVVQLERKNEAIQELVLASNHSSRVRSRREGELQTSEKKIEGTQRALEKTKAEIERLKALQKKESEDAELVAKKLKSSCLRLQHQLKVSEHRVKAKEVLVEKMQTRLQQQVDKENMNKTRDRRAFRNLQDRDPRRANPRDIQALETIGVYETQREQMQEELEHLKAQVAALNSELRDKDNFITRQGNAATNAEPPVWDVYSDDGDTARASGMHSRPRRRYGSSSIASDEVMLEQLEAARREQEVAAAKLRHREAVMVKKVAMIEQELLVARETIGELKEENANLTLETESRPSIRDYRLSQRRIHQLERQVAENKLALEEASDLNELRKYMGTKELVERDRLNHRLHLNRLNTLPRETTLEVVKHVCRVLHLTDITLIAPSLDKLCSVVAAVPRMEKFIRDVCGFVFLHVNDGMEAKDEGSASFELEQVLPTLQQWMMDRRKLHALENFKTSIVTELCKRHDGNLADFVGVRQVREMSILVRELKRELGAATMDEILPRTKRLMELLSLSIHNADPDGEESDYE
ncbi:hypothetical protein BBO99_00004888 [Phytophthora kernoviae]|uniref:Centrosomal protein of 70 kDa n=1 Tax=Phytophthora kernoviae TaxID=325452 RepID=A0A3R7HIL8_9STRA|nr:hypothetical protein JM16_004715 [Phytophthora kernoviae]RLN79948.1 hypothetical protein BBO99_00004888 [Phytophthora kernoviae]